MNKCIVLFVEGETEVEFYKVLIEYVRKKIINRQLNVNVEIINVYGFGGFKVNAFRKFIMDVKPKFTVVTKYVVAFCRDSDVLEYSLHPPVDWKSMTKKFIENGVSKVIHIEANKCIEDWFLYDKEGILRYLRLPKNTNIKSMGNGYKTLTHLFHKANKIYVNGKKSKGFIESIDMGIILNNVKKQLLPLVDELVSN